MRRNSFFAILAVAVSAVFTACDDNISMLTVINSDGSMHREICFTTDSAAIRGTDMERNHLTGVLGDNAWEKEWLRETDENRKDSVLKCRAKRDFGSAEEMAAAYPLQVDGRRILKDCRLKKRFRWFTTEYTFTETYEDFSGFFSVPLSKYLDKEAMDYWLTGQPNLFEGYSGCEMSTYIEEMNAKCEQWLGANILYDAVENVLCKYDSLGNVPVTREELIAKRDTLIDNSIRKGFSIEDKDFSIGEMMDGFFGTDYFVNAWRRDGHLAETMEQKLSVVYGDLLPLKVDYRLAMPGAEIIDCGNGIVRDGNICYRLNGLRLISHDYTISATFRTPNVWVYALSVLVIIAALACCLWKRSANKKASNSRH